MKTTVEIPDGLLREAKSYASSRGLSLKQVVEISLRRLLDQDGTTAKPFRLKKGSFKGRGLASGADWHAIRKKIYEGRGE